ncbi:MAG TPA: hemerythrin domain-containing protein [Sediminibacterium sp.]|nr:hemerythrin domain-containing protein [Sediminibacterium sp.]
MLSDRYNIFHPIHQGLRALMYHASITVQHADFSNVAETAKTCQHLRQMLAFFEGHAHTEDERVFSLLHKVSPETVADFEAQHVEDHRLGVVLAAAISAVETADSDTAKWTAGRRLQYALADFTAFNLTHMNKEESIVLNLLHAHYTDQQLLEAEQGILDSLPLEKKQYSAYWMLKGLSLPEIIEWYKKIQASAPEVIWQASMQLAETLLPKEQLHQLQQAVRA